MVAEGIGKDVVVEQRDGERAADSSRGAAAARTAGAAALFAAGVDRARRRARDLEEVLRRVRRDGHIAAGVDVDAAADERADALVDALPDEPDADTCSLGLERQPERAGDVEALRRVRGVDRDVLLVGAGRRLVDLRALADRRLGREREDVDDHGAGAGEVARAAAPGERDRAELDVGERVQEVDGRDVDADALEQAAGNAAAPDLLVHDQLDDLDGQAFEDRRVQDPEVDRAVQRLDRVQPAAERHVVRDRRDRGLEVSPLDEAELLEQEPLHRRERHQTGVVEDVALLQDSRELGGPLAVDHLGGEPVDRDLPVREARLVAGEHPSRRDDRHRAVALVARDVLVPDVARPRDVSDEVTERLQLLT